ncbi:MAG: PepSY-associated TM helix domain-containing protein [Verrucomicrobium sp.]
MRKRLWMLHSWMGLVAGLGLLLIGLTGSLLMFRAEIESLLRPAPRQVDSTSGVSGGRLSYDELFSRVRRQLPGREVVAWDTVMFDGVVDGIAVTQLENPKEWEWLRADPATGEVRKAEEQSWATPAFDWLFEMHYSLLLGDWGVLFAGVLALLLCLLGLSGVYLYRGFWKTLFTLRWRSSARIFFSDLHKMVGISSVVFNLILGITGAWWNLPTWSRLMGDAEPRAEDKEFSLYNTSLCMDALVKEAVIRLPGLDPHKIYLSLPPRNEYMRLMGSVVPTNTFVGEYNSTVQFNPKTGTVEQVTDYRQASPWEKFEVMMGPLHFGTFGALPIKILWCILGLSPGVLAWTGVMMYWKRRRAIRGKSSRRQSVMPVDAGQAAGSL